VGGDLLANSEDLTVYRQGLVFVSAGNVGPLLGHHHAGDVFEEKGVPGGDLLEAAGVAAGHVFMLDLRRLLASNSELARNEEDGEEEEEEEGPVLHRLPIQGLPSNLAFHPHGLFYSNTTGEQSCRYS
jgi:hypothetical protein